MRAHRGARQWVSRISDLEATLLNGVPQLLERPPRRRMSCHIAMQDAAASDRRAVSARARVGTFSREDGHHHVEKGFDFLGQNVRKYPNGKLLIKPSKKNIKTFLGGIRKTIKAALGMSAADLIHKLNPKIRDWTNYHRHVVSTRTFACVDHHIFSSLWRWARRRHPNKTTRWCKQKYFALRRGRDWSFFGETCDDEGQPDQVWLRHARSTSIQRHVKVKSDANPYDPAYEIYFEKREGTHMQETFRGTRTLRFLWHEQHGLCLCAIPKSLGSRVGACTTAFPV
jgi:hypothetical protein